jgi:hypothetical protein
MYASYKPVRSIQTAYIMAHATLIGLFMGLCDVCVCVCARARARFRDTARELRERDALAAQRFHLTIQEWERKRGNIFQHYAHPYAPLPLSLPARQGVPVPGDPMESSQGKAAGAGACGEAQSWQVAWRGGGVLARRSQVGRIQP